MKQNGLNVASDFMMTLNTCEIVGGLVVIVCDDPSAISSNNEEDPRPFAKWVELPLLEPMDFQQAKDMTKWAFDLSEEMKCLVIVRGQTRISHARGNVRKDELPSIRHEARFKPTPSFIASGATAVSRHHDLHQKIKRIAEIFDSSPFNSYIGPERPELLIISSGICALYCLEAIRTLDLEPSVGILQLGTVWPLPRKLIEKHLGQTKHVLFVEQVDPFIEDCVRELFPDLVNETGSITFSGKHSGHMRAIGELNSTVVMKVLSQIMTVPYQSRDEDYSKRALETMKSHMVTRGITLCPGCSHRATFWVVKNALKLVGGDGFVTGDIGCYALGLRPAGYSQLKTLHAMGSGTGLASGFGQLTQMGFKQPVLAVCGDSTFYHAAIPALINSVYNQSNFTLLVLDNTATAMTGHQPHPGTGKNALGNSAPVIDIADLCRSMGIRVEVVDPFDLKTTTEKLTDLIEEGQGIRVLIVRRKCELVRGREEGAPYAKVYVDTDKCLGSLCGCNQLCTRVFKCPGIIWDRDRSKAQIDEAVCVKCGVCADICPESAIVREVA
jgi:indolepyruvate ferredoxin oxidoreductase alpha subunit